MTFSLVARCADTGMFGMVISSSSPAVAARCAFARAGVGAVASQNVTNPALGPAVLEHMASGQNAPEAVRAALRQERFPAYRQILAVDASGGTAIHSGPESLGIWTTAAAENVVAGGNLLANDRVPQAMVDSFLAGSGHLGDRLIAALSAGLAAGGEAGPVHSAGLLIVDEHSWPLAELRCDWSEDDPVGSVAKAWSVYRPQIAAYVQRALDPRAAPSYGVPGNE